MNEKINNNSLENPGNQNGKEPQLDIASQLFNKENSIDLNSMMQLATTLLKNETLMSSVTNKINQNSVTKLPAENEKIEVGTLYKELENVSNLLSSITQKLEVIANDLSEMRKEREKEKNQNRFTKFLSIFK
jgi:hypothetical protein